MLQRWRLSAVVEAVAPWKSTVICSPGVASPQMWMGMLRWRTMWLEKSLGRVTSAWAAIETMRSEKVSSNFMGESPVNLYIAFAG